MESSRFILLIQTIRSNMLQLITHRNSVYTDLEFAKMALDGGCRWIQLRMKETDPREIRSVSIQVKELCQHYGATFILDDHVELALEIEADGVHLGKNDMSIVDARKLCGSDFIIGGTANSLDDMIFIAEAGGDYIGLGPFRFTTTKQNLSPTLGLEGYQSIMRQYMRKGFHLPVVAIGGITVEDIGDIMKTGVNGVALSSEILNSDNPTEKTKQIIEKIELVAK